MESTPGIRNLDLSNQISVQVAKKAMDVQRAQGLAAIELVKQAADAGKPRTSDGRVDTYA
jgi:hypothetical protein